jgi:hypothetical protein
MRARDTSLGRYVYWTSFEIDTDASEYTGPGPVTDVVIYTLEPTDIGAGTLNTMAKWTAPNQLGDSLLTDDGVTLAYGANKFTVKAADGAAVIGSSTLAAHVISGRVALTSTDTGNHAFAVAYTPAGTTVNDRSAVYVAVGGTADATAGNVAVNGFNVDATTTRSAGINNVITQGLRVFASGGQDVRAGRFSATGGEVVSYGVNATTTAIAIDNFAVHGAATGAGTTNYGGNFTATGATTNIALRTISGDVFLNATAGNTAIGVASGTALTAKLRVDGSVILGLGTTTSHAINGRVTGISTDSTATPFTYAMIATGGVTGSRAAIRGDMTGTYDTTGGSFTVYGVWGDASATKSAGGANNLVVVGTRGFASGTADDTRGVVAQSSGTGGIAYGIDASATGAATSGFGGRFQATGAGTTNVGVQTTATGAGTNIALKTIAGNVLLNNTSGTTTIGFSQATTGALTVNGAISAFASTTSISGVTLTWTPAAGTQSGLAAIRTLSQGTFDTTAGALNSNGVYAQVTSTRSAGANILTNIALRGDATGGTTNTALQTDSGNVLLNGTSGSTTIGFSAATSGALQVNGSSQFTSSNSTVNALSVTRTVVAGTTDQLSGLNVTSQGTIDSTAGILTVYGVRGLALATRSGGANNVINQGVYAEARDAQDNRALRASTTGSGTTNYGALISSTATGTLNYGVNAQATGAGTTNIGVDTTATGATTNIALRTVDGTNYLNATTGNTAIGVSSGTAIGEKLRVQTAPSALTTSLDAMRISQAGTFDATGTTLTSRGLVSTVTSTRSAGANSLTNRAIYSSASGAQFNVALQTDDGNVFLNSVSGTTTLGFSTGTASALVLNGASSFTSALSTNHAFQFTSTPVAGTTASMAGIKYLGNGTFDTTAGALTEYGIFSQVTATRSAGANNLTNVAGRFTATGGQVNQALKTDDGDVVLNGTSGVATIGFSNATASALTISGQTSFASTLSSGNANTLTWTPSNGTISGKAAAAINANGTLDTTAGALSAQAIYAVASTSRGAGANNVTTTAGRFTASGGQDNRAIWTEDGDVRLNTVSGQTFVGFSQATANALTTSGTSTFQSTLATGNTISGNMSATASTTSAIAAIRASQTSTYDTTAGTINGYAMRAVNSATRSAGANNLILHGISGEASGTGPETRGVTAQSTGTGTNGYGLVASASGAATTNVGVDTTATGGTTNISLRTNSGDVLLNATAGTTTLGAASAGTTAKLTITGMSNAQNGVLVTYNPTAGTTSALAGMRVTNTATIDTTAGTLTNSAFFASNTGTRSAGANSLINVGYFADVSGGQQNIAIRTDNGSNYFNTTSGQTAIGLASGSSITGNFHVAAGGVTTRFASTVVARASALSAYQMATTGTFDTTAGALNDVGLDVAVTTTRSAGANSLTNTAVQFTASGAQVNVAIATIDGSNYFNITSGSTGIGYASGAALPAKISATSTGATSLGDFLLTTSGSVSTLNTVNILSNGTFDTTAGALNSRGVNASVTSTRSAGANSLANIAGQFNASGAQVNVALRTDAGDNYFNSTSGSSGVGIASGGAFSGKFHVFSSATAPAVFVNKNTSGIASSSIAIQATRDGTVDTTAGVLTSTSGSFSATSTRSAGANALTNVGILTTASGAQVNVALQTDDGNVILNNVSGTTTVGFSNATAASLAVVGQLSVSTSSVGVAVTALSTGNGAQGTRTIYSGTRSATSDATAADRFNYGFNTSITGTRSAGANNVYNIGAYLNATGGQINVGLQTDAGSNYFHTTSGSSGFGYALGAVLPATLSVTGTFDVTSTATLNGALTHKGASVGFYNTAPIAKPTPTGSRAGNAALASLLTELANLGLITDGTSA